MASPFPETAASPDGLEYRRKPMTKTVWVNLYRNKTGLFSGCEYATRADADREAGADRFTCVPLGVPA